MKFVVVTYGTEGDTRPLAALCRALMEAGHDVQLLADGATLGSATALGVPATALAGDIRETLQPSKQTRPADTARALARIANANAEAWLRELVSVGKGCDAIILSALASFVGLSAAEYLGVKAIGAGFIPITPTVEFPPPLLPPALVPGWLNRPSYNLVNSLVYGLLRRATNAARASVCGLPPRKKVWTGHPILYGVSPSLLPRPHDYPPDIYVCGQWVPPAPDWSPPQDLVDFLGAGEPPLYLGFGSMAGLVQPGLLKELIAAVAGRRVLFYPGWSNVRSADLPSSFFVVRDTPHSWLFPQASVVIHHGGAGTTHSAARAGVPSVVVPLAGDQFFWAHRLERLGVAPAPVKSRSLRAATLARSIELAEEAGVRARSVALGAQMATEKGLPQAISAIETLMMSKA
jgi:UDP:flavonoid glycosyltransferase YjiC (YdhE family)